MQYSRPLRYIFVGALATLASCESLADDACLALVSRARDGRHYTVDAIMPICEDELKHSQCEFIAQSLSLAMSHPGFNGTDFCAQMDAAAFCSDTMDALLTSQPVEDLAYGQCLRAHKKDDTYCRRFQTMFREAVESRDLNTLRACFKIEVEHNPKSVSEEAQPPVARIIASGSQDLTGMGKGTVEAAPPSAARNKTAEPVPPERPAEEAVQNQSTSAAEPTAGKENIIVDPIPATGAAADVKQASQTTRGKIIVDPVPLPKKQAMKPNGTIIVEPVPLANASAQKSGSDGWDSASIFGEKDASPPPQVRPAAPGRGVIVEPAPLAMSTAEGKTKAEQKPIVVAPVPATMYVIPSNMQALNSTAGLAVPAPGSNATDIGNAVQSPVTSIVAAAAAATLAAQAPVSNAAMVVPGATPSPVSNVTNLARKAPISSVVAAAAAAPASTSIANATLAAQAPVSNAASVVPAATQADVTNASYLAGQPPVSGTEAAATTAPASPLATQAPVSNTAVAATPSEPVVVVPVAVAAPLSNTARLSVVPAPSSNAAVVVPTTAVVPASNAANLAVQVPASNVAATSKVLTSSPAVHDENRAVSNAAPVAATASPASNSAGIAVQEPTSHIRPVLPTAAVAAASNTAGSAVQPVVGSQAPLSSDAVTVAASKAPVGSTLASHAPKAASNAPSGSNTAVGAAAVAPASNTAATATVVSASVHAASANPAVAAAKSIAATTNSGALIIPLLRATIPRNAQQTEVHGAGLAEARAKVARKSASAKHDMEKAEYNGFLAKFIQ